MSQVTLPNSQTVHYQHNALGQRVVRSDAQGTEHWLYDLGGQLIAVADSNGNTLREYVYLDGQRIAMLRDEDPSQLDTDNDGIPNDQDTDDDGDGVLDINDAFPLDPNESADTDGDGVGNNADAFPNDPNEWADSDGDGIGDNSDTNTGGNTGGNTNPATDLTKLILLIVL